MWPFWFVAVLDVIQMAEAIEMPPGVKTGVESEDPHSDGGSHLRRLANTTK